MDYAILTAVGISHLVTSLLLVRALDRNHQLRRINAKLRDANRRLINATMPARRTKL
jgi:hypothetical protein